MCWQWPSTGREDHHKCVEGGYLYSGRYAHGNLHGHLFTIDIDPEMGYFRLGHRYFTI